MMVYFPRLEERGGPLGTGEPEKCPGCDKWFVPTPGMEGVSCCVAHGPGTCCHFSETEVPRSGGRGPAFPRRAE